MDSLKVKKRFYENSKRIKSLTLMKNFDDRKGVPHFQIYVSAGQSSLRSKFPSTGWPSKLQPKKVSKLDWSDVVFHSHGRYNNCNRFFCLIYSGSHLVWSLWDRLKLITLTKWKLDYEVFKAALKWYYSSIILYYILSSFLSHNAYHYY